MSKNPQIRSLLMISFIVLSMLACNLNISTDAADAGLAATQTLDAVSTIAAATLQALEADSAVDAEQDTTDGESPPDEIPAEATPSPTIEIVHLITPGSPASTSYYVIDSSTAAYASQQRSVADSFSLNRLERPYIADGMVYQPHLDIVRAELYISSPWVYITIFLEGEPPADSKAWYAMEIDLDMNGRGNVLVAAERPPDSTWTTEGVRVFKDTNFDVGGARAMQNDSPPQTGNGYETIVFERGIGDDQDAAWARISPSHPDRIQLAFKYSLLANDDEFLWGAWTDEGVQEAEWFDYHDHFSQAEAGSPLTESSHYPLAAMHSMDNTCRWTYGFQPTEPLPGLCPLPTTPTPTPTPTVTPTEPPPVTITGRVFNDVNNSSSLDGSDTGLSGVTVQLYRNSCSGSTHQTTSSSGSGWFTFNDLPAGVYCVQVNHSSLPAATYGWYNTVPGSGVSNPTRSINLNTPGSSTNSAHFGFVRIIG